MKKLLFVYFILPFSLFSQQTITSVQNGNASNPFTWSCTCYPSTNDHVIINHIVNMDVNWAITGGGSITVNANKSFLQVGLRSILIDGAGSVFNNNGLTAFNDVAFTNGGGGTNSSHFSVTRSLYVGPAASYTNSGLLDGIDSLLTQGNFTNTGTCNAGNILNTGTFSNSGPIGADSVGNTGTFNSTGSYMYFNAFGNSGTFSMSGSGFMNVAQNWANIGDFTLGSGSQIYANNDFFNGDSIGGSANLYNNGTISITNNFLNGYYIDGSGNFCVGNDSYNVGTINGTLDFCDNTGGGIDFNSGVVAGTVTFCQPGCFVNIDENTSNNLQLYPNPTDGSIFVESNEKYTSYQVYSLLGQMIDQQIFNGEQIQISHLQSGTYFIQLSGSKLSSLVRISIK